MDNSKPASKKLIDQLTDPLKKPVRQLVSQDRIRFSDAHFDLDLSYITDKVIAMGYPGQTIIMTTFFNHIHDINEFLKKYHKDHYMVYNLTEKPYDSTKLDNRVQHFSINDHHPPTLQKLVDIMASMQTWLSSDEKNVVLVHCRAGKGRTGTIISSYLLWSNLFNSAEEAMLYFAERRTNSLAAVTSPSQRRYVHYIERMLTTNFQPFPAKKLVLTKILMRPVPSFTFGGECIPSVEIVDVASDAPFYVTPANQLKQFKKEDPCAVLDMELQVKEDILLRFYHQPAVSDKVPFLRTAPMFRLSFHTSFVEDHYIDFTLNDLDQMEKGASIEDNRFDPSFTLRLVFSEVANNRN